MKQIQNFIRKIWSPFGRLGQKPEYDWRFSLSAFVVILGLVLITNVVSFLRLTTIDSADEISSGSSTVRLSKSDIQKTVKNTQQRDIDTESIPSDILKDPSR